METMIRKTGMIVLILTCFALLSKPLVMAMANILESYLRLIELISIDFFGSVGYKYVLAMIIAVCLSLYMKRISISGILAICSSVILSVLICTKIFIDSLIEFGDEFYHKALTEGGSLGELGGEVLSWVFNLITSRPAIDDLNLLILLVLITLIITIAFQMFGMNNLYETLKSSVKKDGENE